MDKNTKKLHQIKPAITKEKAKLEPSKLEGNGVKEAKPIEEARDYHLYFDGGSRGNGTARAIAGSGYLIKSGDGDVIIKAFNYLGKATNNEAEYDGLVRGLEKALELGIKNISCFGDSLLVINQMKGSWKVKNPGIKVIHHYLNPVRLSFDKITYTHVYREDNKEADALANKGMDMKKNGVLKTFE